MKLLVLYAKSLFRVLSIVSHSFLTTILRRFDTVPRGLRTPCLLARRSLQNSNCCDFLTVIYSDLSQFIVAPGAAQAPSSPCTTINWTNDCKLRFRKTWQFVFELGPPRAKRFTPARTTLNKLRICCPADVEGQVDEGE